MISLVDGASRTRRRGRRMGAAAARAVRAYNMSSRE
jgi:hypothetical protein